MGSNFTAAYAALDATVVTFTFKGQQVTPTVKTLTELPESINGTADLPMRLLLSMDGIGESTGVANQIIGASAGGQRIDWKITDLMLLVPQTLGRTKDVSLSLAEYMENYADMIRVTRNLATGVYIQDCQLSAGTYQFPATETGTLYFGVQCINTLMELT